MNPWGRRSSQNKRAIKNLFNEIMQETTLNTRKYMDAIGKQAVKNLK